MLLFPILKNHEECVYTKIKIRKVSSKRVERYSLVVAAWWGHIQPLTLASMQTAVLHCSRLKFNSAN